MEYILYTLLLLLSVLLVTYLIIPSDKLFNFALNLERKIAGLTLKTVSIFEGKVTYLESKNKELPTLLLLHGFAANKDNWTRMSNIYQINTTSSH